jgi:hypothetical protein
VLRRRRRHVGPIRYMGVILHLCRQIQCLYPYHTRSCVCTRTVRQPATSYDAV